MDDESGRVIEKGEGDGWPRIYLANKGCLLFHDYIVYIETATIRLAVFFLFFLSLLLLFFRFVVFRTVATRIMERDRHARKPKRRDARLLLRYEERQFEKV